MGSRNPQGMHRAWTVTRRPLQLGLNVETFCISHLPSLVF
ncbi:hypothetical protein BVRB_1g003140 [Beta vulgaris subsp. vulgaris]|nr:hypothetical protein BVRB_1g003140 [Beta vulgaris subsp. vulgaris]